MYPRFTALSSTTTLWWMRLRPSERTDSRAGRLLPMVDLTWVTLSCATSDPLAGARPQHGCWSDVLDRQPATGRNLFRTLQVLQRLDGGVHDVDRVVRAERLAQHIVDAGALQHGTHRAAGDDAGTRAGRTEQHDTGRRLTLHGVRDGGGDARHLEHVLLGLFDTLGDGRGDLLGLAVADADRPVAVTDDDQGGEGEPPPTLDDLGDPVGHHDALEQRVLLDGRVTTAVTAAAAIPTVTRSSTVAGSTGSVAAAEAAALGSGHQISLSIMQSNAVLEPVIVRTPVRRCGRRPPARQRARDRRRHRDQRRLRSPLRRRRAGRPARRPCGPWRSCPRRRHAGPPPGSRPRRACGRSSRRPAGRRCAGTSE